MWWKTEKKKLVERPHVEMLMVIDVEGRMKKKLLMLKVETWQSDVEVQEQCDGGWRIRVKKLKKKRLEPCDGGWHKTMMKKGGRAYLNDEKMQVEHATWMRCGGSDGNKCIGAHRKGCQEGKERRKG